VIIDDEGLSCSLLDFMNMVKLFKKAL